MPPPASCDGWSALSSVKVVPVTRRKTPQLRSTSAGSSLSSAADLGSGFINEHGCWLYRDVVHGAGRWTFGCSGEPFYRTLPNCTSRALGPHECAWRPVGHHRGAAPTVEAPSERRTRQIKVSRTKVLGQLECRVLLRRPIIVSYEIVQRQSGRTTALTSHREGMLERLERTLGVAEAFAQDAADSRFIAIHGHVRWRRL